MIDDTQTELVPIGTAHPLPCPEDGGRLLLSLTQAGLGYICENKFRTGCHGNAGANADGTPMGIPGNEEVRTLRNLAHQLFDPIWQNALDKDKTRREMIEFMRQEMHIEGEFHFSNLQEQELHTAIKIIQTTLKRRFS